MCKLQLTFQIIEIQVLWDDW